MNDDFKDILKCKNGAINDAITEAFTHVMDIEARAYAKTIDDVERSEELDDQKNQLVKEIFNIVENARPKTNPLQFDAIIPIDETGQMTFRGIPVIGDEIIYGHNYEMIFKGDHYVNRRTTKTDHEKRMEQIRKCVNEGPDSQRMMAFAHDDLKYLLDYIDKLEAADGE
jgi:hypothetical protein